jgi:hypothetical protein
MHNPTLVVPAVRALAKRFQGIPDDVMAIFKNAKHMDRPIVSNGGPILSHYAVSIEPICQPTAA